MAAVLIVSVANPREPFPCDLGVSPTIVSDLSQNQATAKTILPSTYSFKSFLQSQPCNPVELSFICAAPYTIQIFSRNFRERPEPASNSGRGKSLFKQEETLSSATFKFLFHPGNFTRGNQPQSVRHVNKLHSATVLFVLSKTPRWVFWGVKAQILIQFVFGLEKRCSRLILVQPGRGWALWEGTLEKNDRCDHMWQPGRHLLPQDAGKGASSKYWPQRVCIF